MEITSNHELEKLKLYLNEQIALLSKPCTSNKRSETTNILIKHYEEIIESINQWRTQEGAKTI